VDSVLPKPSPQLKERGLRASPDSSEYERTYIDTVLVARDVATPEASGSDTREPEQGPRPRSMNMRKVIVWNMVTLDGFFEGSKPWEIEWHEYAWGDELQRFSLDQTKEVGTLLFGRRRTKACRATGRRPRARQRSS
jgi:hypothetical protein